ncbi:MAG: phosphoglycolate phosphatase [Pseudomonadota bacterium]
MRDVTLVFDLDGTLVDTAPDLVGAANHVLAGLALAPLSAAELRPWISFGARRMIVEALALRGERREETTIDTMLARFLDHYVDNIAAESRPFPGAVGALDRCLARGATLAVCTNKRHALAVKLLDALALTTRFGAIAGRDTFPVSKPHPDHLSGAVKLAGGNLARSVLVGDSAVDVATARAAGVPFVGVSFGYTDTPMHALGPDAIIDHFDQLDDALSRLLAAA